MLRGNRGHAHRDSKTLVLAHLTAAGLTVMFVAGCGTRPGPVPVAPAPAEGSTTATQAGQDHAESAPAAPPLATPRRGFVGTDRCRECHAQEYASYQQTMHSRSLAEVVLEQQPPAGSFSHPLSGRRYEVLQAAAGVAESPGSPPPADNPQGVLRHREWLVGSDGDDLLLHDLPMKLAVGSGRFAKTFLAELDGFLQESPVTWYESRQTWGMSPGYDRPIHRSFQRTITTGCMFCHAGHVTPEEESDYRFVIHEKAIGCERCHGPGESHVAWHQSARSTARGAAAEDPIVNPSHLPRESAEAVCQQCHLQGEAQVLLPGVSLADYRPGQPLKDYRLDFLLARQDGQMTVVGHVEQLQASLCYLRSETLTCTTCHDPHQHTPPAARVSFYRQRCLACHGEPGCRVELAERETRNANDCVTCHMPQAPTEVPHIAFTHHRIGRHESAAAGPAPAPAEKLALRSFQDLASLPASSQDRAWGLAYLELFRKRGEEVAFAPWRDQARDRLLKAQTEGADDALVYSSLAWLARGYGEWGAAEALAREAIQRDTRPTEARIEALDVLADLHFRRQEFEPAARLLEELTRFRREAKHWFYRGLCQQNLDQTDAAIASLRKSLQIEPQQIGAHQALAAILQVRGQVEAARKHREAAEFLTGEKAGETRRALDDR